jgi:predicted transcriptional regulator
MKKSIRQLPRWQILARLKAARIRQADIAAKAGVSQPMVCRTISREAARTEMTERIWQILEAELAGREKAS